MYEIRLLIAFAATFLAAIEDAKTSFIDDRLLYAMIIAGVVLNLLYPEAIVAAFAGALVIGVLGFFLWRSGQFGSGDVLLFIGLHLLLPASLNSIVPFPVVSIFVASSFFASIGSSLLFAMRLFAFRKKIMPWKKLAFGVLILVLAVVLLALGFSVIQKAFFFLLVSSLVFSALFMKEVMDFVVVRKITLKEMEDEDVLALDKMPAWLVKKYSLGKLLDKAMRQKLALVVKKEKIRRFPVCKELPRFGPYVLAALAWFILFGDLVAFVFLS